MTQLRRIDAVYPERGVLTCLSETFAEAVPVLIQHCRRREETGQGGAASARSGDEVKRHSSWSLRSALQLLPGDERGVVRLSLTARSRMRCSTIASEYLIFRES